MASCLRPRHEQRREPRSERRCEPLLSDAARDAEAVRRRRGCEQLSEQLSEQLRAVCELLRRRCEATLRRLLRLVCGGAARAAEGARPAPGVRLVCGLS
jgi:hypothetical protein